MSNCHGGIETSAHLLFRFSIQYCHSISNHFLKVSYRFYCQISVWEWVGNLIFLFSFFFSRWKAVRFVSNQASCVNTLSKAVIFSFCNALYSQIFNTSYLWVFIICNRKVQNMDSQKWISMQFHPNLATFSTDIEFVKQMILKSVRCDSWMHLPFWRNTLSIIQHSV